jgi:uncharacterized protein YlxP (DUF503 family)
VITNTEEFKSNLTRWADHLENIAVRTTEQFDRWEADEISQAEFIEAVQVINETMQQLKRESDLKTEYEMEASQEEQIYYERVLHYYDNAKKNLNDFLVLSQEFTATQTSQIKDLYTSRVQVNFNDDLSLLKESLAQ